MTATEIALSFPEGAAFGPDGSLYLADTEHHRVRRIGHTRPVLSATELLIPSEDATEAYVFDSTGRHLRTYDAMTAGSCVAELGQTACAKLRLGYDAGLLVTVEDFDGNVTAIEREVNGDPTAIVSPFGQTTGLTLDANGYLAGITNPANETAQFTYTPDGLMSEMLTPRGHRYDFTYHADGRLFRDNDPAGGFKELRRTEQGEDFTVTLRTAMGRERSYAVENVATGEIRRTNTEPDGSATEILIGRDKSTTTTSADGTVRLRTLRPDDRYGLQAPVASTTLSTPGGRVFDAGTTRSIVLSAPNDPLGVETLTDTTTIHPGHATNERIFATSYDAATRTLTSTTPVGRQTVSLLDAAGRVVQTQLPDVLPIAFTYDARGRLQTITQGARVWTLAYDAAGNLQSMTNPLTQATSFEYDLATRVKKQILPDLREILFGYDASGNLTGLTPPGRPVHAFGYTEIDQEELYDPPAAGLPNPQTLTLYSFDRQLDEIQRPDNLVIDFQYDPATAQLLAQAIPNGTIGYAYDAQTGQLVQITAADLGALTLSYDGFLLTRQEWAGTVAGAVSNTYDDDLRIATESVNDTSTASFGYDKDGLVTQADLAADSLVVSRDPESGRITDTTLGGITDAYTYNTFGELETYTASFGPTALYSFAYVRDALGSIAEKTETLEGQTTTFEYTYDSSGRLTDVEKNSVPVAHYDYDANGNRTAGSFNEVSGAITNAVYDDQDRLLEYTTTLGGTTTYTYTANGELQTKTDATGTTTYTYDVLGNLLSVELPHQTLIEYVVDGRNRRIGKKVNGVLEKGWLYKDQLNPVAELDGAGNVVARFVYGAKGNVPEYMIKNGEVYRFVTDHLGSPRLVVDVATGAVVQRMEEGEFGNVSTDTSPAFQPFGFAGGLYEADTGLVRFGARDYDPIVARWASKDPARFRSADSNHYAYVGNDPINLIDPTGNASMDPLIEAGRCFLDCIKDDKSAGQCREISNICRQLPPPQRKPCSLLNLACQAITRAPGIARCAKRCFPPPPPDEQPEDDKDEDAICAVE